MKINELLKPNEGFNLNEAQLAGNRVCFYVQGRTVWKISKDFNSLWLSLRPLATSLHGLVDMPLVFTHAFPGVAVSPSVADGNVPFSSVFPGWGNGGAWGRTWETKAGILCRPTLNTEPDQDSPACHCAPPALFRTREDIMMSEIRVLTFAASLHGKNFKPKWQTILLGREDTEEFRHWYPLH